MKWKLAKRLSDKEKKNIAKYFADGKAIDELAREFECSKPTIIRNLQKQIGQKKFYKKLIKLDPLIKEKINPTDIQRSIRAYEVKVYTKKSLI